MRDTATELERILDEAQPRLLAIDEKALETRSVEAKWSRKEILGHLIDSAANNHQRFVRAQFTERLETPNYEQEGWVKSQAYATEPWPDLVNLWLLFNRHLLHVVKAMPDGVGTHELVIGGDPVAILHAVVVDYLRHMDHHLAQIFS